jgi:hypothetical protein
MMGAARDAAPSDKTKERIMLRNFAAALLATTLIAGPAFAAQPSGGSTGSTAPAATAGAKTAVQTAQPAKHLRKHARSHTRKHAAHRSMLRIKTVHHYKGSKTHKAQVAPVTNGAKMPKAAGAQPAQLPTTRTN